MSSLRHSRLISAAIGVAYLAATAYAQQPKDVATPTNTSRARGERDVDRFRLLNYYFRAWLNQDVLYIISPEERSAFLRINSDEGRAEFIRQFWAERNSDTDSLENTFEHEHYRRIAYANEHFGGATPGWKSDRGRAYIIFGEPDLNQSFAGESNCYEDDHTNAVVHDSPPGFEWKYRYLEGVGENVDIYFVLRKGDDGTFDNSAYRLSMERCRVVEPTVQDYVDVAMLTATELTGMTHTPAHPTQRTIAQHRDLSDIVSARLSRSQIPVSVEFTSVRATSITSLASLRVSIPTVSITFPISRDQSASASVYGRFKNIVTGQVISQFESSATLKRSGVPYGKWTVSYDNEIALPAGIYELGIGVEDYETGSVTVNYAIVSAGEFQSSEFAAPLPIIGDAREPTAHEFPSYEIGVQPRTDSQFLRGNSAAVFWQIYNASVDETTKTNNVTVFASVSTSSGNVWSGDFTSDSAEQRGEETTIRKSLPIENWPTGSYLLKMTALDGVSGASLSHTIPFEIVEHFSK
jgi:GWxTD domain-containing protein